MIQLWRTSKLFRVILIIGVVYGILSLGIQVYYLSGQMNENAQVEVPIDAVVYMGAAERLLAQQPLYPLPLTAEEFFQYSPVFALFVSPLRQLSPGSLVVVLSLVHLIAYPVLFWRWRGLFRQLGLVSAERCLVASLPLWIVFEVFWSDWAYMNIYVLVALLGTLLVEAVLAERAVAAGLILSFILAVKPQWAFAAAIPLLLRRWRLLVVMLTVAGVVYLGLVGATILATSWQYGVQQYADYFRFLAALPSNYPWPTYKTHALPGYNHSIMQWTIYWLGNYRFSHIFATLLKGMVLTPLAVIVYRIWRSAAVSAEHKLDLAFLLYLGTFVWLDWLWELALMVVMLPYLWADGKRWARFILVGVGVVASLNIWRLSVTAMWGLDSEGKLLFDPARSIPLYLFALLGLYVILVRKFAYNGQHISQ